MGSKLNHSVVSVNGGEIGPEVQGRIHLEGYTSTAALLQNLWPLPEGPLFLRPGMKFLVDSPDNDFALLLPFVFSVAQSNLLMLTDMEMRIVANDGIISRPAVTSAVTNGGFTGSLSGWTDISAGSGAASEVDDALELTSDGSSIAGVRQQVSTSSTGVVHALNITVDRGPVEFRVGSSSGDDDYISTRTLRTGYYSLSFTPSGSYWIEVFSREDVIRRVDSIEVASAGDMVLPTPWGESVLRSLRKARKRDVTWINSGLGVKKRLERQGLTSWGLVDGTENDGPFLLPNFDSGFTLTPSVKTGNGTLTANRALFQSGHVGSIWEVTHTGQNVVETFTTENQFSEAIRVTGVENDRAFSYELTNLTSTSTTVTLQRSIGNETSFTDYQTKTSDGTFNVDDGLDNQIVFYRLGVKSGDYSSGTITGELTYSGGSTIGIARATAFTSSTEVDIEVIEPFGDTTGSSEWAEGAWSDVHGYPKAVALFDGRKWEGRDDEYWGSVSGAYESYALGDEAADAIAREIDAGDANAIQWMVGMERLAIGTEGAEPMVRSNAFDEPVTPSNLTLREVGTFGSADVEPIRLDMQALFVERSGWRVMELVHVPERQNYVPRSLMRFHKNLGRPGVVQLAAARQPDTRAYMVRSDGVCLVKLYEAADGMGWARMVTDGEIESVAVLPGLADTGEDQVYFMVKREVDGNDVRYLEKLEPFYLDDVTDANMLDCYVRDESGSSTTLSGLDHLEGREVILWGDGAYMGTATVDGGEVTFPSAKTKRAAGLYYEGRYQSSKLAFGARAGTALGLKGAATHIAFLLTGSTRLIQYGKNFDEMDQLDDRSNDTTFDTGPGLVDETTEFMAIPGSHTRDPRLCLKVPAPFPVTIQGLVLAHDLDERIGSN